VGVVFLGVDSTHALLIGWYKLSTSHQPITKLRGSPSINTGMVLSSWRHTRLMLGSPTHSCESVLSNTLFNFTSSSVLLRPRVFPFFPWHCTCLIHVGKTYVYESQASRVMSLISYWLILCQTLICITVILSQQLQSITLIKKEIHLICIKCNNYTK